MSGSPDITVRVLDEGRRAQARIPPGFDLRALTPALLTTIASGARVQITPDVQRRITAAIGAYARNPAAELLADIAVCVEPVHGSCGGWAWEPGRDPAAAPVAGPVGDKPTDHHASHVASVAAGAQVARFTPPGPGVDGRSVTGAVLPAKAGPPACIVPGDGLLARPDGAVVAAVDGVLGVAGGIATISSVLSVAGSVDFSTGTIDFKGDVRVADAVRDGFVIRAAGSITVNGPVEGAELSCGGDLSCPRGIASSRRAKVLVAGDAAVGYLRNVSGVFRGDLACRGEIEHSHITVGGRLRCESGRVIGGTLVLTGVAHIGTLGSPDWVPTLVCVGELPLVAVELRRLDADAVRLQRGIAGKDEALARMASQGGKCAKDREQLTELQYERSELQREAAAIQARRDALNEAQKAAHGGELHISRVVHPKTRIQHGAAAFEFQRELKGPFQFILDSGGMIRVKTSAGEPRPITEFAHAVRAAAVHEETRKCA